MEAFLAIQARGPHLLLRVDVATRWNSTFRMLVRAIRLQSVIDDWSSDDNSHGIYSHHRLRDKDWVYVRYLVALLYPFFLWTESLSATSDITIHKAWSVYSGLFQHLELSAKRLTKKSVARKVLLANSVDAAHKKLAEYYTNTDGPRGHIYNWATILDPSQRLETYQMPDFRPELLREYKKDFLHRYNKRYALYKPTPALIDYSSPAPSRRSFAALTAQKQQAKRVQPTHVVQVTTYVSTPTTDNVSNVLAYWQAHEGQLPGLAQMAIDVLAVPISGVGVERVFSLARLVCSYIRNRLCPSTISKLMFVKHAERQQREGADKRDDVSADKDEASGEVEAGESEGDYAIAEKQLISDDEEEGDDNVDAE